MKKLLIKSCLILLNLIMMILSIIIYYRKSEALIKSSNAPDGVEAFIFIPILFIGIILLITFKKFRKFGIGLITLTISGSILLVFYLNKSLATSGNYKSFKLERALSVDQNFFLKIKYNRWDNLIKVTQEKCITVDSVEVKINKGFFGFEILSDDIKIVEKINCSHEQLDTTDLKNSHLKIGYELAKKRCFSEAIYHYSKCIKLDPTDKNPYYNRGLMYMILDDYKMALLDFLTLTTIEYSRINEKSIKKINNKNFATYTKNIFENLNKKEYDGLDESINNLSTIINLYRYKRDIEYCMLKIKQNN